ASLAVFVFKRTQEIMIDMKPEKFKALININRNIAAGLMSRKPQAETPKSKLEVESQKEFVVSDV
ncbi:MAG: hypothetical protein KAH96_05870, partial [Alphaproteobacteria bacterium]|nr:hypothetical protein [Alphaproteobacteria bacterium]